MKTFLFTLVTFLFCSSGICQDVETIVKEAERLEAIPDETGAYHKLKEALAIKPNHVHALAKCSEMCSRIGKRQKDATLRDDYYKAAKIYAETALKFDPNNSEANCSMAIALGRTTMSKSGKEKM
ncbi:MAG TPA: hypothetical protein VKH37_03010, partial [Ferruginibacter sp.]|nr:hypothetical protein [Ferruginibacter sp.]